MSNDKNCAQKRLYRDWKELESEKENSDLTTITALPTKNILVWHCNLRPDDGPFRGTIVHLILQFPSNYPKSPPNVQLCTSLLGHPNVYGDWICLDMIQESYTNRPYAGWTSAYSVLSILLQLQSFLFAENIPQNEDEGGGTRRAYTNSHNIALSISKARAYICPDIESHDGTIVKHTHVNPWPPFGRQYRTRRMRLRSVPVPTLKSYLVASTSPVSRGVIEESETQESEPIKIDVTDSAPAAEAAALVNELPSDVYTQIFSFLGSKDLIGVRDVCSRWRKIVYTYNIFDRSQIMCYHSKVTLDNPETTILGFGLAVQYYPDGKNLKEASSPLDLLSWHAFRVQSVRKGVWDGQFMHLLPLVFDKRHATKALPVIKDTIFNIMKNCELPGLKRQATNPPHRQFHPYMAFQLLVVLMNSMVVELMNSSPSSGVEVRRYASEKALEGYCAFHHMLLHFAKTHPCLVDLANSQIESFLSSEKARTKRHTPNLGLLLVSLTLTNKGWNVLRKPLIMEVFDRNVRWLIQKCTALGDLNRNYFSDDRRLAETFIGARTSLRLLMFQVYFMSTIGRPSGTSGPFDVLARYEKRLGKPTTAQKEDLLKNAKEILAVNTWVQFFKRLGGPVPSCPRLVQILRQAVVNSANKGYHRPPRMERQRHHGSSRRGEQHHGSSSRWGGR